MAVLSSIGGVACSGSSASKFDDLSDGGGSGSTGDNGNGGSFGGGGNGSGGNDAGGSNGGTTDDCSDAAKLVYVVSASNELYSFTPNTLTFKQIGVLDCPANGTPNSMAVDRSGTAWVNYSDGTLYKVSTKDASCQSTNFQAGQHKFGRFGMAFVSNAAGSKDETLFISGIGSGEKGLGLATVDLSTLKVALIGNYSGSLDGINAELTGTGNGTLFGFFTTNNPNSTFAQIDKQTAKASQNKAIPGTSDVQAWAFSFWGGDFWFYTATAYESSKVTRLKASGDGSISVVKQDVGGFQIVGAGVSTCAPTVPPPVK